MKRFFNYCLGVLYLLFASPVFANEKFEVLPDLPETLSYAVQPVQAAAVSGSPEVSTLGVQTIGNEPSLVSVVLSLIFVLLLIYLTGIVYTKLNKLSFKTMRRQHADLAQSHVSVISTTQLGNNKTLHVVELDGKRMLIGASSNAIQLIKDLGGTKDSIESEEYSHIEIPNIKIPKIEIPKIEIPSIDFSKLMTKTHRTIDSIENDTSDNEAENNEQETQEEALNSECIIDSLFVQNQEPIEEVEQSKSEHTVDPDDFALYKKYLS
jgi:flagellar biogenesis protein FliO